MEALIPDPNKVAKVVEAYNARFGAMDPAMWALSKFVQASLLRGENNPALEDLVWTVRKWWGVSGQGREIAPLMAKAISGMNWSSAMFDTNTLGINDPARFAIDRVSDLVQRMKEIDVPRNEFSWASKVLHLLMPWRVPPYDSFVRESLNISKDPDKLKAMEFAYQKIVKWHLQNAERLMAQGSDWIGKFEPKSPLRALDKYLWWNGGGEDTKSYIEKDPWKICRPYLPNLLLEEIQ